MSMIGLIGVAIGLVGAGLTYSAQMKMANAQEAASKKAENAREQQMQLDSAHRKRQAVREAIVARSMSLSAGVNANAQDGSGVAASMGQATAMGGENQQVTNSTEILGSRVFAANREYFEATRKGQQGMAFGQALGSFGGALQSAAPSLQRLGTYFGSPRTA